MAPARTSEVSLGFYQLASLADSSSRKKKKVEVNSDFVGGASEESDTDASIKERLLRRATKFLRSKYFANFIVLIVLLDAYCTCLDIDSRAAARETPTTFLVISNLCLGIYTFEFLLLFVVEGRKILTDWTVVLDLLVIFCGFAELLVSAIVQGDPLNGINVVRALRLGRILRLTRFLRKLRTLRELHKLATMMATCAKTLVWSFLLCFMVMTVWSMLMVETVNPLLQKLQEQSGTFDECGMRCQRSMTSVMEANLLLFQTVIAGDGWAEIAVPLIQAYPACAIIFMGSSLTLVFGVLNLIVAVVVDTFADARQNDVQNLAEEMEDEIQHDRKSLAKLFSRIDADGSGQVTLEELIEGARTNPEFQSRLRVMDIDESDLQMLFEMIDLDGSGAIEAAEFVGPLSRWAHDSKTAPRFIKYNLMQTMKTQEDLYDLCEDCFKHLALQIDKLFGEVKGLKQATPVKVARTSNTEDEVKGEKLILPASRESTDHFHVHASKEVGKLLVDKSLDVSAMTNSQISISLERVLADLHASLHRMEAFSLDADNLIKKWSELPIDTNRRNRIAESSTGSNGSKADVFWAHYMDRDRDTGTKRKTLKLGTPANAPRSRGTLGGGSSPGNLAMLKKPSNRSSSVASETPSIKIHKSERDEDEGLA